METAEYLDKLLLRYSGSFDIYQPYVINDKEYPAYGYFFSCVEKYVLVREANMWTSKSYEHILFLDVDEVTIDTINEIDDLIRNYMEPTLVCKGESLPEENHMYSYLSVVVISNKKLSSECQKAIRRYKFEKGYRFNMRGFSQGRVMCCSMEDEKFYSNHQGKKQKELYRRIFTEVHQNKPGYKQFLENAEQA